MIVSSKNEYPCCNMFITNAHKYNVTRSVMTTLMCWNLSAIVSRTALLTITLFYLYNAWKNITICGEFYSTHDDSARRSQHTR